MTLNTKPQPDFSDATPELYELFKAREAQAKAHWEDCVRQSLDLKAALGLDDTTFLTHLNMMAEMSAEDDQC